MTWIRIDTDLRDHRVVGRLSAILSVPLDRALGLYTACLLGFGEHQPNGFPDEVADSLLEHWALWTGKAGRFATAFRAHCVETEADQKDPIGRIKGWWRQEALLRKQEKDRQRPGSSARIPHDSPEKPARVFRGNLGGDEDDDGYVDGTTPPPPSADARKREAGEVAPTIYAQQCTGACNRGLRQNPAYANGKGFNELVTSAQLEFTAPWQAAGIPVNFAAGVILTRAAEYKPTHRYPQPINLRYFDKGVREAWERANAATAAEDVTPIADEAEDEFTAAARRVEARMAQ